MSSRRQTMWRMRILLCVAVVAGLTWGIGNLQALECVRQKQAPSGGEDSKTAEFGKLADLALQDDVAVSDPALARLRELGPAAVEYLMNEPALRNSPRWSAVIDAVAQQKDAGYCGLYWHTDLDQALAAAKRENKPVLSLRLLGNLTDELSCANSRFFRTTLYPHAGVRELLSRRFVLHWQSVRAVPIITIDFGDGRRIRRTITGNSLHLILDNQGRTIDVLPGLYAPAAFAQELEQSAAAAARLAAFDGEQFQQARAEFHRERTHQARVAWVNRCRAARLNESLPTGVDHQPEIWTKVAAIAGEPEVLDATTRRAVIERGPPAEVAGRQALAKAVTETPVMRLVRNVSRVINEDSVRNEYYLHVQIHNWFAAQKPVPEREDLVRRVYSELFLSPLDDPWYGLSRPDVFSAIKNDGHLDAVTQNTGD
ncbi:MAG: hypothetical protein HY290_03890 [Planctomycetia bacterium]|nr:hypothetical protein [Planctomycetia bacterium]